jgi:ATP-binding cassette subfamily C (CFTR/MRP) protein 1
LQNIGTIPVVAVNLAAAITIVPLSYLEHSRSVRASAVLEVYLIFSSLFEFPQVRTLFLIDSGSTLGSILLADICCKVALLALEGQRKTSYLRLQYQPLSLESLSGIVDRSFLWWLNGIFSAQYLDFLNQYQLDPALATENVGKQLQNAWDQRGEPKSLPGAAFLTTESCYQRAFPTHMDHISRTWRVIRACTAPTISSHCLHIRTAISHYKRSPTAGKA